MSIKITDWELYWVLGYRLESVLSNMIADWDLCVKCDVRALGHNIDDNGARIPMVSIEVVLGRPTFWWSMQQAKINNVNIEKLL